MHIADAMTRDVKVINPTQSIVEAARMMADSDCGSLPVAENDHLIGMLTDRDIVVRALAEGKTPETKVKDIITPEVKYCFEEDDVSKVARNMGDLQIRRLPVLNQDKRLVGIVSLGDIAHTAHEINIAGKALSEICERTSEHTSTEQRPS